MATATMTRNWSDQFRPNFQEIEANPLEEGATALMYACQQENIEQLRSILRKKPEAIRERDRTLKTVLHYCAENVTLSCAEIVLNAAPDLVDVADEDGYTTLHLAVIAGNIPLVNFLISKSADINALDNERHSVIHWATVCGEIELLDILLKCGANPSTPDVHGGYPIHYAAQMCGATSEMGNDSRLGLTVLRALLHQNIDVNVVDHDGRQPVLWAASAGSSDAAIALINAGASVQAHDKDGLTALHCAASRGHTDCLETLIELCAADVDVIDNNGCSPLFYSVTLGHADATQLLLRCGASPNRQDRKGRTPAHCGAAKGQFETLRILKKHGGNLWIRNSRGDYCFHESVNSGRKDLVKWLLSQRPDAVNASNSDGRCPLHIAAITNNIEMCKILLDFQSLVNPIMRTSKGDLMTPLDAALHKGNRGCAKYLQLHGGVPASKLTSYSAALRGPHKSDAHSDYQGSPLGKLETPFHARGSRSLDTSPSGFKSSRRRKVQVHITADVTSRKVEESFSDVHERCHKHRRKYEAESVHHPRAGARRYGRATDECSFSSHSYSTSSDVTDYSSETDHRTRRRRRRRRWHADDRRNKEHRTRSRTRKCSTSRSKSRGSEHEDRTPFEHAETKLKVKFENESIEIPASPTEARSKRANDSAEIHQTVTAVVHREDEKHFEDTKPSESSENGYQEVQYQKLDTEVTDTDVFVEDNKLSGTGERDKPLDVPSPRVKEEVISADHPPSEKTKREAGDTVVADSVDLFDEKPFIVQKEGGQTEQAVQKGDVIPESLGEPKREMQDANLANDAWESKPAVASVAQRTEENEQIEPQKEQSKEPGPAENEEDDEGRRSTPRLADIEKRSPQEAEKEGETGKEDVKTAENDGTTVEDNKTSTCEGSNESANAEAPDENVSRMKLEAEGGLKSTIRELEKFKEEKLEEHFTKDKGLICVILDDDETIEIKRKKDGRTKGDHSNSHRTRSASRRKEKSLQKRQRRSKSSFEVLSDDANNEPPSSRLAVHDDSGFEPSPRHCPSRNEDASHKLRSRIPRATNRYQSDKQKETETNINVSSVTQAVQNSLRKYHLERRVFHTLLELKRLQIRAGKSNEQVLVKRLVDDYQKAGLVVGLRPYDGIYSFRHFERYLYEQLRILQSSNKKNIPRIKSSDDFEKLTKALKRTKAGKTLLENVPDNPLFCTHGTHRCIHATHAYTGIPCAAYIAKLDHHKLPKPNENYRCFLPRIDAAKQTQSKTACEIAKSLKHVDPSKPVTLELIHGTEKQIISLPTEKLDKSKRYYVTFTIKGGNREEKSSSEGEKDLTVTQSTEKQHE